MMPDYIIDIIKNADNTIGKVPTYEGNKIIYKCLSVHVGGQVCVCIYFDKHTTFENVTLPPDIKVKKLDITNPNFKNDLSELVKTHIQSYNSCYGYK